MRAVNLTYDFCKELDNKTLLSNNCKYLNKEQEYYFEPVASSSNHVQWTCSYKSVMTALFTGTDQNSMHEKYYTAYIYTCESKWTQEWQGILDHTW